MNKCWRIKFLGFKEHGRNIVVFEKVLEIGGHKRNYVS